MSLGLSRVISFGSAPDPLKDLETMGKMGQIMLELDSNIMDKRKQIGESQLEGQLSVQKAITKQTEHIVKSVSKADEYYALKEENELLSLKAENRKAKAELLNADTALLNAETAFLIAKRENEEEKAKHLAPPNP